MKAGNLSSASFVQSNGWGVGTYLYGAPILSNGKEVEAARFLRITAIGERSVLARCRVVGADKWWDESSWDFNSREWELSSSDAAAEDPNVIASTQEGGTP